MIPKIIHHQAPKNKDDWHPLWDKCRETWLKNFPEPEYKHMLWDDNSIDKLVEKHYNDFSNLYKSFKFHINRLDFARCCILHYYGGIYADLDLYCYKNFYDEIKDDDLCLVESPILNEVYQNCLMASKKGSPFWFEYMVHIEREFYEFEEGMDQNAYCMDICGPLKLSFVSQVTRRRYKALPLDLYNPPFETYSDNLYTKHYHTGIWGKDNISYLKENMDTKFESFKEFLKEDFRELKNIDLDSFDFQKGE